MSPFRRLCYILSQAFIVLVRSCRDVLGFCFHVLCQTIVYEIVKRNNIKLEIENIPDRKQSFFD